MKLADQSVFDSAKRTCVALVLILLPLSVYASETTKGNRELGAFVLHQPADVSFHFGGPMGERISANLENWLLTAPNANPGMIEMFRMRDRKPVPSLVDWAGEFVGKYLISAIQARRMTDDPRLDSLLNRVIAEFISTQADDGYLGPFPKEERLLRHWDLWGHYHCMLALLMWYDETGDTAAQDCAVRAADLICKTYLDTDRRIRDMGAHEMNMAVIHVLGRLYRMTGNERYLGMMRKIEKEWEEAGDYFRMGLQGVDFYRTPRPRWESLHDIQGLVELYRITGHEDYRTAFQNIWRSIARFDRHNTGGFSTFERAIGNPYTPGAIETCCTIAWVALTVDMLQLTGDCIVADELEWSTWNSVLGSQHPSGRWCTYDTPMDGQRLASAHSIVFQSRAGTPELNCCSVNAPRGLGMLSEWAFLTDDEGLVVNYYGPLVADLTLRDNFKVHIAEETNYPANGHIAINISPQKPAEFAVKF
ncbi:MAG: beta-L-arabinofuranosidase domain-containing protein, partial [bacterium]